MRRAARTDATHQPIVKAFKDMGCSVLSLAGMGKGVPDLLVSNYNSTVMVEVKDGETYYGNKPRKSQEDFKAAWKGRIFVCKSIVEVPNIVAKL